MNKSRFDYYYCINGFRVTAISEILSSHLIIKYALVLIC